MDIIDDFANPAGNTRAGCICNENARTHADTKGVFSYLFSCNYSCIGAANRDANHNCAKVETRQGK